MITVTDILERLYQFKGAEYAIHERGLPDDARENLVRLCQLFEASRIEVRREIISKVGPEISFLFLNFGRNMATAAVRQSDEQSLVRGRVAAPSH